ncbi:TetR/AcrR family transcriptional regulator [Plantibacter sp. Mn2098]|uniref:TetR/AcrR family transcriptional regulator n=1 Tax=Plantibacter sp. Mn2098 TaxID=3395266 RepID=UPI003BE987F9
MTIQLSQDEILRRGLDAFAELGYDAASVRELGRRIGVNHNFINDRYGSKLDFWRTVVDYAIAELGHDDQPEPDDPALALSHRVHALFRTAAQRPQLYRLVWDEASRDTERLDYLFERYLRPAVDETLPTVKRAAPEGARIPVDLLYFVLTGAISGIVQEPLARRLGRTTSAGSSNDARTAVADALASYVLSGLNGEATQPRTLLP